MKTAKQHLEQELRTLLKRDTDREILETLADICSEDIMIDYLQKLGYNIVKIEGLNQQMDFEDMVNKIFASNNERQANLFLNY